MAPGHWWRSCSPIPVSCPTPGAKTNSRPCPSRVFFAVPGNRRWSLIPVERRNTPEVLALDTRTSWDLFKYKYKVMQRQGLRTVDIAKTLDQIASIVLSMSYGGGCVIILGRVKDPEWSWFFNYKVKQ